MSRYGSQKPPAIDISYYEHEGYFVAHLRCAYLGVERIVPPAGEEYAYTVDRWRKRVEVAVSPTGRSVRVWVDGVQV